MNISRDKKNKPIELRLKSKEPDIIFVRLRIVDDVIFKTEIYFL